MELKLDNVNALLEERGISAEDVACVVTWGEGEGGKLTDGDKNLARKRLGSIMLYVEYTSDGSVTDVYSHRVKLVNSEG